MKLISKLKTFDVVKLVNVKEFKERKENNDLIPGMEQINVDITQEEIDKAPDTLIGMVVKVNDEDRFIDIKTADAHYLIGNYIENLTLSEAVELIKDGRYVMFRRGWNGNQTMKDSDIPLPKMWVFYSDPREGNDAPEAQYYMPYLSLRTPIGTVQPGWLAAQPDILENDWCVISIEILLKELAPKDDTEPVKKDVEPEPSELPDGGPA